LGEERGVTRARLSVRLLVTHRASHSVASGALVPPIRELSEQRAARRLRDILLAQRSSQRDCLAELLDVGHATWADTQVALETRPLLGHKDAFEVVGDEFDEFLAGELGCAHADSMCCSSVARNFARARCRSTL